MKVENPIILSHYILMFVLAPCLAVSQTHFTFHSPTDNNATVAITTSSNPNILGQPLEDGDEIGVFTPDGLCAGAVVWHLANTALTVWGDDSLTPETDGFKVGEELDFRIWDKSEDKEYEDVNFAFSSGPSTYQVNGISVLQFMTAVPVELVSLDAKVSGNQVTLYWVTATETNNYGFEIERSQDRIKFTKLGFLEGKETTSVPQSYSFLDSGVAPGKYYYRLKQIDTDGSFEYSEMIEVEVSVPFHFDLFQNHPNPFNAETEIRYQLPEPTYVTLKVFNAVGQEIRTLVDGKQQAGLFMVRWDGKDNFGRQVSSGLYFYTLRAGEFHQTRKALLLR